jgi:hypothetical protein
MKKIVLFTAILAFVASSSFAASLFINFNNDCESNQNIEMISDQGEKTKSSDKESKPTTTEKKTTSTTSSSTKSSCKKSCKKSCDDKSSKESSKDKS